MNSDCYEGCIPAGVKDGNFKCCGGKYAGKKDNSCPGSKYRCDNMTNTGCVEKGNSNLAYQFINGGMGYGSVCMPDSLLDMIIVIIFPPMYVITYQLKQNKMDIGQLILNFLFTSCFYFPGFIHALYIMKQKKFCGSVL